MRTATGRIGGAVLGISCAATLLTACASTGDGHLGAIRQEAVGNPHTAAIKVWFDEVNPAISTVEQSITYAQWTVRRPAHRGLTAACHRIRSNIRVAEAATPAPDRIARHAISRELTAFDTAAVQCLSGELPAAGASINRGHHWAETAGRRIVTLLHRAVTAT